MTRDELNLSSENTTPRRPTGITGGAILFLVLVGLAGCRSSAAAEGPSDPPSQGARPVIQSKRSYTKPAEAVLRRSLTPVQYEVTQRAETEPAFRNAYWNNHTPGLYVDVATGEPL